MLPATSTCPPTSHSFTPCSLSHALTAVLTFPFQIIRDPVQWHFLKTYSILNSVVFNPRWSLTERAVDCESRVLIGKGCWLAKSWFNLWWYGPVLNQKLDFYLRIQKWQYPEQWVDIHWTLKWCEGPDYLHNGRENFFLSWHLTSSKARL